MKFSILIPAYKDKYLYECIESILSQTYKDFEVIIVDDASPYNLFEIVDSFKDNRIKYYRNEKNCGAINVVDNWNICLDYAKGEYVICMGDDDKLLPFCLEEYIKLMEKYPGLGIYHSWAEIIDENSNFLLSTDSRCEYESVYSLIWHRWHYRKLQFIGDFLFNTSLLRQNGGFYKFPLAWFSDDISVTIAAQHKGIANTQVVTFQYRMNSNTITSTGNSDIKMQSTLLCKEWYMNFLKERPKDFNDEKYWMLLHKSIENYFNSMYSLYIELDIKQKGIHRCFHWLSYCINNRISTSLVAKALLKAIK